MAITALPVTSTPVNPSSGLKSAVAASVIPAFSVVHSDANGKLAVSSTDTQAHSKVDGIVVSKAEAAGVPLFYVPAGGKITTTGLTPGTAYYLAADGDICLYSDLLTGEWVTLVCVAESATVLRVLAQQLNIQK